MQNGSILQQRGDRLLRFVTAHVRQCGHDMLEFTVFEARRHTLHVRCAQCNAAMSIPLNHDDPVFAELGDRAAVNSDDLPF